MSHSVRFEPEAAAELEEAARWYEQKHDGLGLAFLTAGDAIRVLAVAHGRRRPGYWTSRAGA